MKVKAYVETYEKTYTIMYDLDEDLTKAAGGGRSRRVSGAKLLDVVFCCNDMRHHWKLKEVGFGYQHGRFVPVYTESPAFEHFDINVNLYKQDSDFEYGFYVAHTVPTTIPISFCPFCGEVITINYTWVEAQPPKVKLKIRKDIILSERHPLTIKRLIDVCSDAGYLLTREQADFVWRRYSESEGSHWLGIIDYDDTTLLAIVKSYAE